MKYNFSIPCNKADLVNVRHFVKDTLSQTKLESDEIHLLTLAIDEACANAIIHGNDCNSEKQLEIVLELDQNKLDVEIYDIGVCHPPAAKIPAIDWTACIERGDKGGLGLFIMNKIMDKVSFYQRAEGYACKLSKEIG